MIELRFRAWDKNNNGFINGFNMIGFSTGQGAPKKKLQRYSTEWDLEDVEIMRCLGEKDIDGKVIFESDIVKDHTTNTIFVVKYGVLRFRKESVFTKEIVNVEMQGFYYIDISDNSEMVMRVHVDTSKEWEVIGNIYRNPELLECI